MRAFSWIVFCIVLLLGNGLRGATYKLTNGKDISGELLPASATDAAVQIKVGEGQYERVLWGNFSQEELKAFATNQKLQPLVEPFIEITREERLKQTAVAIKDPARLELPAPGSFLGAMFSSSLGMLVLAALWAATVYAGFEVAIFRGHPPLLVAGLSAIPGLGVLAPIIFLAMPTKSKLSDVDLGEATDEASAAGKPAGTAAASGGAPGATGEAAFNPMQDTTVAHPSALHIHHDAKKDTTTAIPQPIAYPRGQYTFNRRFIETKFANFFGAVRRHEEKDLVLLVKATRGKYLAQRISRISASEMHLEVHQGPASEEVLVPFVEIQEIRVQHKDQQ